MDTQFTGHIGVRFTSAWRLWTPAERQGAIQETLTRLARFEERVCLRGAYITQGFRADTDLFLWLHGSSIDEIQAYELEWRHSPLGIVTEQSWAFAGVVMPAEFNSRHAPAFTKGIAPKNYICFYPYVRTQDWYLLPAERRSDILKEHGTLGREFPGILTNGVQAFGLGDYEWLLSFETDDLVALAALIRRQREAAARPYTKDEGPFIAGRRFGLQEALNHLA